MPNDLICGMEPLSSLSLLPVSNQRISYYCINWKGLKSIFDVFEVKARIVEKRYFYIVTQSIFFEMSSTEQHKKIITDGTPRDSGNVWA